MSRVHHYIETTGTGTLQTHLLNNHLDEWVGKCQSQNIELKGKEGEEVLQNSLDFLCSIKLRLMSPSLKKLSLMAWFNLLWQPIRFLFLFLFTNLINFFFVSQSELWTERC
jgi:hypothetical protein